MEKSVGEAAVENQFQSDRCFTDATTRGIVHAFVEIAELRRLMARLTAIELLRLMLEPEGSPGPA